MFKGGALRIASGMGLVIGTAKVYCAWSRLARSPSRDRETGEGAGMTVANELALDSASVTTGDAKPENAPEASSATIDGLPQLAASVSGPTTRRALLGAGLGALIATVATALGRPLGARAADGDPMALGQAMVATVPTSITNGINGNNVFVAQSTAGNGLAGLSSNAYGVVGFSKNLAGVRGESTNNDGVLGLATAGNGVKGTSDSGIGVQGRSNTDKGVYGYSNTGPGVYAYSGSNHAVWGYTDSHAPASAAHAGLRGQAHTDQTFGAFAENLIVGTKGSLGGPKAGVVGQAPDALGFIGVSAIGPDAATALSVTGKAAFSRSGSASVPKGKSFVDVSVPGGLSSGSLVVATPMLNRSGVYVQAAVPNPSSGTFRINLNKVASSSSSTPVAWFVIG